MGLHLGLQYIVRRISIRDAEILSVGKIAEFARFAGGERRKSPDRFSFIYPGRRRGYCWREEDWRSDGVQRSGTEAEWQSSDSLCPLGQVFWRLVRLKSWPGFNVQRWRQRVFEDLLAVLEVSPVRWGWMVAFWPKGRGQVPIYIIYDDNYVYLCASNLLMAIVYESWANDSHL